MKFKRIPTYLILIFLFAVSTLLYLNSLHGDFLIDDEPVIVQSAKLHDVNIYFSKYFKPGVGALYEIYLVFLYQIARTNTFYYHLSNVFFNSLCVVLVFILCRVLFKNNTLAFLSGLIFAAHPIHTEVVSWISGGHYAFSTTFILLSAIFYIKSDTPRYGNSLLYFLLAVLFFALAVFAGHMAGVLPLIFIAYELFFSSQEENKSFRKFKLFALILILLTAVMYLAGLFIAKNSFMHLIFYFRGPAYLVVVAKAFVYYLKILYLPMARGLYHPFAFNTTHIQDLTPAFFLSLAILIAAVIVFFKCRKNDRPISWGIMWFLVAYAPFSNLIPMSNIISERYMYLASVGFSIFTAALFLKAQAIIEKAAEIRNFFRPFSICVITLYLSCYAALTVKRNYEYSNIFIYWKTNIENFRDGYIVYNNLAATFYSIGNIDNAIAYCWIALMVNPNQPHVWCNLGKLYREQKNLEQAKSCYQEALKIDAGYLPAAEILKEINAELEKIAVAAQIVLPPKEVKGKKKKKKALIR